MDKKRAVSWLQLQFHIRESRPAKVEMSVVCTVFHRFDKSGLGFEL